jgi:hypothetical protein
MWDQNYKHGFGVFTFQDGEQYIGRFHNDKMIDYNSYGFSIPNLSKPQNERISSATLKQGDQKNIATKNSSQMIKTSDAKVKENIDGTKGLEKINEINEKNLKENLSETSSKPDFSGRNKTRDLTINKNTLKENALEAISEQAELFNMSVLIPDNNKIKESNAKDAKANNNNKNPNVSENNNNNSNNNNNPNNTNNKGIIKNDFGNSNSRNVENFIKEKIEKEFNIFQTLIDIKDLIECDPEIEFNLREIEYSLLRHLSEMKMWYKYYINKEYQKEDNQSQNVSVMDDRVSVKDKEDKSDRRKTVKQDKDSSEIKDKLKQNSQSQVQLLNQTGLNTQGLNPLGQNANTNSNPIDKFEGVYTNDLSFAMELKDLWKFLRESNVLSIDFSLAQFNRLFFKGNKNFIEMFMPTDEMNSTSNKLKIYENKYQMIRNSKNDFFVKFRDRLFTTNITNNLFGQPILTNNLYTNSNNNTYSSANESINTKNNNNIINKNSLNSNLNENMEITKINNNNNNNNQENFGENYGYISNNLIEGGVTVGFEAYNNFDQIPIADQNQIQNHNQANKGYKDNNSFTFNDKIHNKRQIILLRHFYEAILRSAYLRYSHLSIGLHSKINNLIDTCIKTNINFKKVSRKSQMHTESSINSSVIVDMKQKSFELNFEFFIGNFESRLKFSFKKLYQKSNLYNRLDDMTISYRFFYDKIIKKSENLMANYDKIKFIELINIYHKDKINISETQKFTKEQITYIENLLDIEFIFYEYCELIFFITRKILTKNNLNETKENYIKEITEIEKLVDNIDSVSFNEKNFYIYPRLKNHLKFEDILANKKAREEELMKIKMEQKRVELERNIMKVEDTNILPEFIEDEDCEEDSSIYSNY